MEGGRVAEVNGNGETTWHWRVRVFRITAVFFLEGGGGLRREDIGDTWHTKFFLVWSRINTLLASSDRTINYVREDIMICQQVDVSLWNPSISVVWILLIWWF